MPLSAATDARGRSVKRSRGWESPARGGSMCSRHKNVMPESISHANAGVTSEAVFL